MICKAILIIYIAQMIKAKQRETLQVLLGHLEWTKNVLHISSKHS